MTHVENGSAKVRYAMNSPHRVPMTGDRRGVPRIGEKSTNTGSSISVPGMLCRPEQAAQDGHPARRNA